LSKILRDYAAVNELIFSFELIVSSDAECCYFKPVHRSDKLVFDWPFAPLLCICSLSRAPSPICALLSRIAHRQYVGDLIGPRKVLGRVISGGEVSGDVR